jgi:imidazole glycerol-phosphate synthase subunit HisH
VNVVIVDYGMGNLASVRRALEECGARVLVSGDPGSARQADALILPGVGAFADGMAHLKATGWADGLKKAVAGGTPLLGICLGMQLLADKGFEGGECEGLGLISGQVKRLESGNERIPHVGWNEVVPVRGCALLEGIPSGTDFYFVHSYQFLATHPEDVLATTPYCGGFASIIGKNHVAGTQFHPEKSSKKGFCLIRNFLESARIRGAVC